MSPAKPDLAEFYSYSRKKKPPCQVGVAREQLNDDEKAQLDAAFKIHTDTGAITSSAIVQWLKKRAQTVTTNAIVSHRKGTCTCDG